ncbi:hypothetical protein L0F63_006417 [Massospora cicadina]|nr:hypothetical protein L0F63_006417 [Massospora cicadina]
MSHRALRKKLGWSNNSTDQPVPLPIANKLFESEDELLNLTKETPKRNKRNKDKFTKLASPIREVEGERFDRGVATEKLNFGSVASEAEVGIEPTLPNPFGLLRDEGSGQDAKGVSGSEGSAGDEPVVKDKPSAIGATPKRKAKRKGGPKPTAELKAPPFDDELSMREFEKLIEDVNAKFREQDLDRSGSPGAKEAGNRAQPEARKRLLAIDPRNLEPMVETTRLFGSKIVQSVKHQKRAFRFGRCILAAPRDNWPPPDKPGLAMDSPEEADGVRYFHFTHNNRYRELQRAFYQAVVSLDPNNIAMVTHLSPYHVDTLLQLSEIAKHSGQVTEASELIERALFSCEKGFHPTFSVVSGDCRLNYAQVENRPFFFALFRRLQYLSRQGCWRTALEYAKLILSLSPNDDPLGMLFLLDFLALKSKEYRFVLDFARQWPDAGYLRSLPNFSYSHAVASFRLSDGSDSSLLLGRAIVQFPSVSVGIGLRLKLPNGPALGRLRAHAALFESSVRASDSQLKALGDLYLERAHSLWSEADMVEFMLAGMEVATQLLAAEDDPAIGYYQQLWGADLTNEIPLALCRHIAISELPGLMKHLPSDVRGQTIYMHDPIPPPDSVSLYDDFRLLPGYGQPSQPAFGADLSHTFFAAMASLGGLFRTDQQEATERPTGPSLRAQPLLQMLASFLPEFLAGRPEGPTPFEDEATTDDEAAE